MEYFKDFNLGIEDSNVGNTVICAKNIVNYINKHNLEKFEISYAVSDLPKVKRVITYLQENAEEFKTFSFGVNYTVTFYFEPLAREVMESEVVCHVVTKPFQNLEVGNFIWELENPTKLGTHKVLIGNEIFIFKLDTDQELDELENNTVPITRGTLEKLLKK